MTRRGRPARPHLDATESVRISAPAGYVAVIATAAALYLGSIGNGYNIDDETVTAGNPVTARGVRAIPEIFSTNHFYSGGQRFEYRPLAKSSFAIEHELFGPSPRVGHAINVAVYAAGAGLLLLLLSRVLGERRHTLAVVATLLFVAHPLHTEVVNNVKSRDELLAFAFAVGAALLFLRRHDGGSARHAAAGAVLLVAAFLCKLSAAPFIALIPACLLFSGRIDGRRAAALAAGLGALGTGYLLAIHVFLPGFFREIAFVENPLVAHPDPWSRLGTGLMTSLFYLEKLFWPHPLAFYYGYDTLPVTSLAAPAALAAFAVHGALLAYALLRFRSRDAIALGIAWYLIAIAMYSNVAVLTTGIVAERSAFLASAGFCLALTAAILGATARAPAAVRRPLALAVFAFLFIASAVKIQDRNADWASDYALFEADLPHLQRSVMAHRIHARHIRHNEAGREPSKERSASLRLAVGLALHTTEILPSYAAGHALAGSIYLHDLGDAEAALTHLERATTIAPEYEQASHDAMMANIRLRRLDDAWHHGQRVLVADPDHVEGLYWVSKLAMRRGDTELAFAHNRRLLEIAPDRDLGYLNLGYFHHETGESRLAVENLEKALAIAPDNRAVALDLAGMLTDLGEHARADRYRAMAREAKR